MRNGELEGRGDDQLEIAGGEMSFGQTPALKAARACLAATPTRVISPSWTNCSGESARSRREERRIVADGEIKRQLRRDPRLQD